MVEIVKVDKTWQQAQVFQVRRETFIKGQNISQELEFDEEYGKLYHYILILDQGRGIGTARINLSHEDYGKIERVAIIPEFQGQGLGRQLIEACEAWIWSKGIYKVVITSQLKAAGFYEKVGYVPNPAIKTETTIPTVYTEKILSEKKIPQIQI